MCGCRIPIQNNIKVSSVIHLHGNRMCHDKCRGMSLHLNKTSVLDESFSKQHLHPYTHTWTQLSKQVDLYMAPLKKRTVCMGVGSSEMDLQSGYPNI